MSKQKHPIYSEIYRLVRVEESVQEPFSARNLRLSIDGWSHEKLGAFLASHCQENRNGNTDLFIRVYRGRYRLNDKRK